MIKAHVLPFTITSNEFEKNALLKACLSEFSDRWGSFSARLKIKSLAVRQCFFFLCRQLFINLTSRSISLLRHQDDNAKKQLFDVCFVLLLSLIKFFLFYIFITLCPFVRNLPSILVCRLKIGLKQEILKENSGMHKS